MDKLYVAYVPVRIAVEAENIREARAIILRLWQDAAEVLPVGVSTRPTVGHVSSNTVGA